MYFYLINQDGAVLEYGTHNELMSTDGLYHTLVMAQLGEKEQTESHDYFSGGEALGTGYLKFSLIHLFSIIIIIKIFSVIFFYFISAGSCEALHSSFEEKKQYRKRRSLSLSFASLEDPDLDRLSKEANEVRFCVTFH